VRYTRAVRRWLKSYVGFCYRAYREESKRSRAYRSVSYLSALTLVVAVIEWVLNIEFALPEVSGKTRAILLLAGFAFLLLIVIEALRRYHERIVGENERATDELNEEWDRRAGINEKIGEYAGECMYYGTHKEVPLESARQLIENARRLLEDNLGEAVANTFFNPLKDKIPEDDLVRLHWMQGRAVQLRSIAYQHRKALPTGFAQK
jgi:hypothetical protein